MFLSLYCLGMFWACLSEDLAPFRVTSKFLCIKVSAACRSQRHTELTRSLQGIIFFSFWQGLAISILVAAGLIKNSACAPKQSHEPYTDVCMPSRTRR